MVTPYAQGYSAENELNKKLQEFGYEVKRAYKSQGCYDLLAFNDTFRPLLIEVKYYKAMNEIPTSKVNQKALLTLLKKANSKKLFITAKTTNAYPLFAFKIKGKGWLLYRMDLDMLRFYKYKDLKYGLKSILQVSNPFP